MDLDKLTNKHLSRYFDGSKTIPEDTVRQLLKFLRSAPTSTNIQPNHFIVLSTPEGKAKLAANLGENLRAVGGKRCRQIAHRHRCIEARAETARGDPADRLG